MKADAAFWAGLRYFRPDELNHAGEPSFPDPFGMSGPLLLALDHLRHIVGVPITVHGSFRPGDSGQHGRHGAVDCSAAYRDGGLRLYEFWLAATRIPTFQGIGFYTGWEHPGLHLDDRDAEKRALWWTPDPRPKRGSYLGFDRIAMNALMEV